MVFTERDYLDLTLGDAQRQWQGIAARRAVPTGSRQVAFVPVETLLCLAAMYVVDHSRFGSSSAHRAPDPIQQLGRLFKRPPSSILAKMANLDGSRAHGARFDLLAGATLRSDSARMAEVYRTILAGARSAGIGEEPLPDFLHIERGGVLELLGQEELADSSTEASLERELQQWVELQGDLPESVTERLLWARVRVGQHRFAKDVLTNCGSACVFCGFAMGGAVGPSLLRASHIKPWRDSNHRERLEVTNGIAACPTHDAAFDVGLITVDSDLTVHRSGRLRSAMAHNEAVRRAFEPGAMRASIALPSDAVAPGRVFVDWHRANVFAA
ncbi:HNH endonuclease [Cellulomonas timonensis]|uniref:HNH endonuclease n=1 Tax=Cellulomonas timonensis TaxID=1689271 RepID=UPI000B30BD15|nr:HNH endonuclease [Cellulomonas timonensis]